MGRGLRNGNGRPWIAPFVRGRDCPIRTGRDLGGVLLDQVGGGEANQWPKGVRATLKQSEEGGGRGSEARIKIFFILCINKLEKLNWSSGVLKRPRL